MEDLSIDQKKLPGVKEVCRDFAVLEDHCLAHNLQEQEIEIHLASNVHKSRLVQQDLRVAKRMQEEEDLRAKAQHQRQHQDIERIDNEFAQEIQDQLVWQAEQLRQQEEKDEAIARKLQEREMKEERKRQKQLESNFEEQYYEDKGAYRPSSDPRVRQPGSDSPVSSNANHRDLSQGRSPDHRSPKLDHKRRHDRYADYPAETSRSKQPELYNSDGTRGRYDGKSRRPENYTPEARHKYPEEYLSERNRHTEAEYPEHRKGKKYRPQDLWDEPYLDQEPMVSTKDRLHRDDPVDRTWDKEKDRARRRERDQERERDGKRNQDKVQNRDRDRSEDKLLNVDASKDQHWHTDMEREMDYRSKSRDRDLDRERDRRGPKSVKEGGREKNRERSRGRDLDDPGFPSSSSAWAEESLEDADYRNRQRVNSGSNEVFEGPSSRGHSGEPRSAGHPSRERGRVVRGEYGMKETTQGLAQMDLREQEVRDMEVARKLQDEELKASHFDKRAAQVAQDEEIARRIMEEEKKEYKKARDKEKQAMERQQRERRVEGDFKPTQEEVVRPRTREEYDYQRARNNPKPVRPPPPRIHNYENVESSYAYSDNYSPRPPSRPDAAYKGAYYRQ